MLANTHTHTHTHKHKMQETVIYNTNNHQIIEILLTTSPSYHPEGDIYK